MLQHFRWAVTLLTVLPVLTLGAGPDAEMQNRLIRFEQITAGFNQFGRYKVAVTNFQKINRKLPGSNSELGIYAPEKYRDDIIDTLRIEGGGVITVNYLNFPATAHAWIKMVPRNSENSQLQWQCVSNIAGIAKTAPDCVYRPDPVKPPVSPLPQSMRCAAALKIALKNNLTASNARNFQLKVLPVSQPSKAPVLGNCDGGKRKIVYVKKTLTPGAR